MTGNQSVRRYEETEEISWIEKIVKRSKTVEEQIPLIVAEIEAEPIYYKHVNDICANIKHVLKFFYKGRKVKVCCFGSSVTTLAIKDCDVDVFLDFEGRLPEPAETFLKSLRNKISKFGFFHRAIAVPAKVPIVQCIHRSGVSCDISFSQPLSVHNSALIKFMVGLDKRIRPLILILKHLIKRDGQIGITSFSLTLLIVFFLQQLEQPILPAVNHLQNLATTRETVTDWDVSYTTDMNALPSVDNRSSVNELLSKFFEFYAGFEFGFYAISVFTATVYLKPFLADCNLLPEEFKCYKKNLEKEDSQTFKVNKIMCVQDLFNHSNNVTANVTEKICENFQKFCSNCVSIAKEKGHNSSEYLLDLFQKKKNSKRSKPGECIHLYVNESLFSPGQDFKSLTEEDIRRQWSGRVYNSIKDILIRVMKCKVDVKCKDQPVTFTVADNVVLHCELQYSDLVTKKRNEVKHEFEFPQNMPIVNQEELISDYLCDTFLKNVQKDSAKFELTCVLEKDPTCFCLYLETKEEKNNKNIVEKAFKFMETKFPKWIK